MKAERARLKRLHRLEKVRAIAKQAAAAEAAKAEGTLAQLTQLAERSQRMAADYSRRSDSLDGGDLRQLSRFAEGLHKIAGATAGDASTARALADRKLADLAAAEQRRAAVEERAQKQARDLANKGQLPALGSRRGFGTGFE